jgi:predicted transcriptional regulator
MSKAVLISIRPKWCEKIISGEKTIEVRKTRPKMDTPFKCYIYCTKPEEKLLTIMKDGDENYGETYHGKPVFIKTEKAPTTGLWDKRQKVIGEFLCDQIININGAGRIPSDAARPTCLEPAELHQYLGAATGFGWHISNLKIYDTPRELDDFRRACKNDWWCESCAMYSEYNGTCGNGSLQIRRPPQSWCYVEEQIWND